jgi:hypothetical protein
MVRHSFSDSGGSKLARLVAGDDRIQSPDYVAGHPQKDGVSLAIHHAVPGDPAPLLDRRGHTAMRAALDEVEQPGRRLGQRRLGGRAVRGPAIDTTTRVPAHRSDDVAALRPDIDAALQASATQLARVTEDDVDATASGLLLPRVR